MIVTIVIVIIVTALVLIVTIVIVTAIVMIVRGMTVAEGIKMIAKSVNDWTLKWLFAYTELLKKVQK